MTEQASPPDYDHAAAAVLIGNPGPLLADAARLAGAAGLRIVGQFAPGETATHIVADLVLVIVEERDADDLDTALDHAEAAADTLDAAWAIRFPVTLLSRVVDRHFQRAPQFLCDPTRAQLATLFALAGARQPERFHDRTRDSEADRLRRLNEEVARIAETLARLAQSEPGDSARARDRRPDYGAPPTSDFDSPAKPVTAARVRAAIRARRMREQFFEPSLFADPAWDMLLDLFAADLEQSRVSVSSLCIAAAVPPTTALRWITTMTDAGLFGREADPEDGRRAYVTLTANTGIAMRQLIGALDRAGLAIP